MQETRAATLCLKLEKLYTIMTLANHLYLKQSLFSLHMLEGSSIKSHMDLFLSIIYLKNVDVKSGDEDETLLLLCSLPPYRHFHETMIYLHENIILEDVKSSLYSKELMDKELTKATSSSVNSEALFRKRNKDRPSVKDKKSKLKRYCIHCNKKGHNIKQRKTKKRQEKTNWTNREANCV